MNEKIREGVVGNITACHADARGTIPRRGVLKKNIIYCAQVDTLAAGFYLYTSIPFLFLFFVSELLGAKVDNKKMCPRGPTDKA